MKINKKDIVLIFIMLSLFIGDLLLYLGIINLFFKDKETIWAGLIAFTGAILGGAITYYGVRIQIQHREKEMFMSNVIETLTKIDELIYSLNPSLKEFFILENSGFNEDDAVYKISMSESISEFKRVLDENKNIVYKYLDYDFIELIDYHEKFLFLNRNGKDLSSQIDKCREIYNVILNGKNKVKQKYRYYRN